MNVYIKFNIIIHHFSILEIYSTIYGMYDTQIIYNRGVTQDPQKLRSLPALAGTSLMKNLDNRLTLRNVVIIKCDLQVWFESQSVQIIK